MNWIDLTFATPEENLAFDEALLNHCDDGLEGELLRFWEPTKPFVVLGYSNRWTTEVNASACTKLGVPIYRRCSGGGTVLLGPGCLNYTLILKIEGHRTLGNITETNRYALNQNAMALEPLLNIRPALQGHTDLTLGPLKFSGNCQRRRRYFTLIHGTFLLDFDLNLIESCLSFPSLQPDYREGRGHKEFVTNLKVGADKVKNALKNQWEAENKLSQIPVDLIQKLARSVYATDEWNKKY